MSQLFYIFIGQALAATDDIKLKLPEFLVGETEGTSIFQTLTSLVFAFLAVMAFGGIIYSGVIMITASGDATKFATGRKNLMWSIIGIVIVVLSYFILSFVYQFGEDAVKIPLVP